jgi:hypothetical protein
MKYKISFGNHLRALDLLIFIFAIILAFAWYQANQNNLDNSLIDGLIVFALISLLPVLYLHIEYYYYNRGTELEIDDHEKKFIYTNKTGITETYYFDDLSKIIVFMPPHFHSKTMFIRIPFDTYHYAKIFTKSGKEIIITCLMARKVIDLVGSIRGVPIEKKKRIFASILIG